MLKKNQKALKSDRFAFSPNTSGNGGSDNNMGFGNRVSTTREKFINEDGSFNIVKKGVPFLEAHGWYQYLINLKWSSFFIFILLSFFIVNALFAFAYVLTGVENLGMPSAENSGFWRQFSEAFFFSTQTLSTVGYGRLAPIGFVSNVLAAIEALMGVLGFAMITGILYGRFSRPISKITKSKNILLAPFKDGTALMFRIANLRNSQMMEMEVELMISLLVNENGKTIRRFYNLPLEYKKIVFFSLSWTVVHPIDEKSPLFGLNEHDLEDADAEVLVMVKGFDEVFSQTTYSRFSYHHKELVWGARFLPMLESGSGKTVLDISKISVFEKVQLPVVKTKEKNDE